MSTAWSLWQRDAKTGHTIRTRPLPADMQAHLGSLFLDCVDVPSLLFFEKQIQGSHNAHIDCEPKHLPSGHRLGASGCSLEYAYKNLVAAIIYWKTNE